jgi:hypothetical protein
MYMNIDYKTKEQYQRQINVISDRYKGILKDYKDYYIAFNNNKSSKNKKNLDDSSLLLTRRYNELRNLQEEITKENGSILTEVSVSNVNINKEKATNTRLKNQLAALDPIKSSSTVLISDYKTNYNDRNTQNWSLLIGVIVSCALITFMFRIPTTKDQMLRVKDETISKLYKEGSEYFKKFNELQEKGKRKAAEAEAKIRSYYEETKQYSKRVDDYKARADAAAKELAAAKEAAAAKKPNNV